MFGRFIDLQKNSTMYRSKTSWPLALLFFYFSFFLSFRAFAQAFPDRDTSLVSQQLFNILMAQREVEYFATPLYFTSNKFGQSMDSVPSRHGFPFFEANLAPYYV